MSSEHENFSRIVDAARMHAVNLQTDIANAKDRIEHIRLTALAQEAHNLLTDLESYRARGAAIPESEDPDPAAAQTFNETQEVLDLPDFKSPYNPRG